VNWRGQGLNSGPLLWYQVEKKKKKKKNEGGEEEKIVLFDDDPSYELHRFK
jgi:hypothetical protein